MVKFDDCKETAHRCKWCKQDVLHASIRDHECEGILMARRHREEGERLDAIAATAADMLTHYPADEAIYLATQFVDRVRAMGRELHDKQEAERADFWRESQNRSEERRVGKECRSRWS